MNSDHSGHRDRLRNRFIKDGNFENFEPHNILELLLFYSIPRRDTNEIAHELINKFGSLSGVFDASYDDLINYGNVSPNTACLIKSILPISSAYNNDKTNGKTTLRGIDEIVNFVKKKYRGETTERLSVTSLDNVGNLISFDFLSEGSESSVAVEPKEFVKLLLRTRATMCVIAHNHPGNLALPSSCDAMATRVLVNAGCAIGVRVMDHLIIAGDDCVSMRKSKEYISCFKNVEDNYGFGKLNY